MKILLLFLLLFSNIGFSATTLLLIGGGKRPTDAMAKFVEKSGGKEARILIIPFASESLESAQIIKAELSTHSPKEVSVVELELDASDVTQLKEKLKTFTGVFFTGGDQNQLMRKLNLYTLIESLKTAYSKGVAFVGTSAGTAIMSQEMLTGKNDPTIISPESTELDKGLGLLPENIIVDQHFIVRGRFNRLAGLILGSKRLGIGIDEGTALLVTDSKSAEVIGPTQVLFYSSASSKDLSLKVLTNGDTFNFKN